MDAKPSRWLDVIFRFKIVGHLFWPMLMVGALMGYMIVLNIEHLCYDFHINLVRAFPLPVGCVTMFEKTWSG